jgi:hypothetical protein
MARQVKSGNGWRIGWDADTADFCGLLSGADWAIELTALEWSDFCRLLNQLTDTLALMRQELMEEERISLEAESDLVWLEAEGYPDAYCLRFILRTGRRAEGTWTAEAASELVQAIQLLHVF